MEKNDIQFKKITIGKLIFKAMYHMGLVTIDSYLSQLSSQQPSPIRN